MINGISNHFSHDEMELNSYNAAFYELGFRWHWDRATYQDLTRRIPDEEERIRHYLETRQPHLLKAYDAEFLVEAIRERQAKHRKTDAASSRPGQFDWAQSLGCELGA